MDIPVESSFDDLKIQVQNAVESAEPLVITTYSLPCEIEAHMENVISMLMDAIGQQQMKSYLVYCVRELTVNAKKANTKRVYFAEQGLTITDPDDYQKGMRNFKENTFKNINHYLQLQEEQGLYVELLLQIQDNILTVKVKNNVQITEYEFSRIQSRLSMAHTFNTMEEALSEVIDDSEGSGLGLVILILMIRKLGYARDCFTIERSPRETTACITIPLEAKAENVEAESAEAEVVDVEEALPLEDDELESEPEELSPL